MGSSVPPEPVAQVKAILADPKKRAAIHPTLLGLLDKSVAGRDATSTVGVDPLVAQSTSSTPVSSALSSQVDPVGYEGHSKEILNAAQEFAGLKGPRPQGDKLASPERQDAWNLFLGLPQVSNTFMESPFKPSTSKENKRYLAFKGDPFGGMFKAYLKAAEAYDAQGRIAPVSDEAHEVMGRFKLQLGKDEHGHYLSYYDIWDLKPDIVNLLGKPFEIYGRQYYDPKTKEPVSPDLTNLHLKEIQDWATKNLPAVSNARPGR